MPGDMGLVCFDDIEHLAVLTPFLTVIDQPAETFVSLGAQLLFERIAGKAGRSSRRIVLQADLIVRESCCARTGVPRRHDQAMADACLFLLSDRASFITGAERLVDGGRIALP